MQQMLLAGGLQNPTATYIDGATGVDSAVLPAHAIGDLIVCFAFRDGSATPPTIPAAFTDLRSSGSGAVSQATAYRVATVTNTASGTWTNASAVVFVIYRNATLGSGFADQGGVDSPVIYSPLTPSIPNGSSLILGFAGHAAGDTSLQTPPTGMVNRQTVAHASDEAAAHESSAGRYAWPSTNVAVGGSAGGWISNVVELKSV